MNSLRLWKLDGTVISVMDAMRIAISHLKLTLTNYLNNYIGVSEHIKGAFVLMNVCDLVNETKLIHDTNLQQYRINRLFAPNVHVFVW